MGFAWFILLQACRLTMSGNITETTIHRINGESKVIELRCKLSVNKTLSWLKNGKPLRLNYTYMLFLVEELQIYSPEFERDSGIYTCNGETYKLTDANDTIWPEKERKSATRILLDVIHAIIHGYWTLQTRYPIAMTIGIGGISLTLIVIFARISYIYKQASVNYAKVKFVKKGLSLQREMTRMKEKREEVEDERERKRKEDKARKKSPES